MKFSPALILLLLTSLLFTASGTAQQVEAEVSDTANATSKAGPEATTTQPQELENSGAAMRFTPTEQVHADDAVSFPVDI